MKIDLRPDTIPTEALYLLQAAVLILERIESGEYPPDRVDSVTTGLPWPARRVPPAVASCPWCERPDGVPVPTHLTTSENSR